MKDVMKNTPFDQITTAIEENLFAWIPFLGNLGQMHVNNPAGVKRATTDIPSGLFNSIMDARLAPGKVNETIQFIVSDAMTRNVPLLWWIGPSTQPADLGKHLENFGFIHDEESPGMAVDLSEIPGKLPIPDGFSIQLAQNDDSWRKWSNVLASGFEFPPSAGFVINAWYDLLHYLDPKSIFAYVGWLNDKPVATSLLCLAAGVAGIYAVATIPEARRKGIGTWMTLHPLQEACSMGYKVGVLEASPEGLGVYHSIGFREHCRINTYRWTPQLEEA